MKINEENDQRGRVREKNLAKEVYFSENYFSLPQLCSQAQQIHDIHKFGPRSVIEVGLGNGFTSLFLKRAGYDVTTADINPNLNPDICCPIDQLISNLNGRRFDLAVCCEVLEHMPLSDFEGNIKILRSLSDQLYLTLPNYSRSFGFGGLVSLPKINKYIQLYIDFPLKKEVYKEHFWEVGSSQATKRSKIMEILSGFYENVRFERHTHNPYHLSFFCRRS